MGTAGQAFMHEVFDSNISHMYAKDMKYEHRRFMLRPNKKKFVFRVTF